MPALTLHADPQWSAAHWDDDNETATGGAARAARRRYVGDARVVEAQLKRWRFATPQSIWPDPCWSPDDGRRVALAGDAFAGPKVEGAALSGLAAADRLSEL